MAYKDKTALFVDCGLFVSFAQSLAKDFGRVLYYTPWESSFPKSNSILVGKGVPGLTRCDNFWPYIDEIDLFIFPDVYFGGLQTHLERLGKRVWGGRMGEELELNRVAAKDHMGKRGIAIGPYTVVTGIDALEKHLKAHDHQYVKISRTRGDMETFKSKNYRLIQPKLQELRYKLGAKAEIMEFICEQAINPAIEIGYDGFTIDGKFPQAAMWGIEAKDEGYIAEQVPYDQLPLQARECNAKLEDTFRQLRYRGFYSSEIRVTPNGTGYMIDPCARAGSPPSELYQMMITNWADIIWEGAMGNLVEPQYAAKFGAELLIHSSWADQNWQAVEFPASMAENVKLRNHTVINGKNYVVPQNVGLPEIGAVVALGSSVKDAVNNCIKLSERIEGHYIEFKTACLENIEADLAKVKKATVKK